MDTQSSVLEGIRDLLSTGRYAGALSALDRVFPNVSLHDVEGRAALAARLYALTGLRRWNEVAEIGSRWLEELRRHGDAVVEAQVQAHLGVALFRLGDVHKGETHIRAAIHIARWTLEDRQAAIRFQRQLALVFKNRGSWRQALHETRSALESAEESGSHEEIGALEKNLAIILLKSGRLFEVPSLLDSAERHLTIAERHAWVVRVPLVRANYLRMVGKARSAFALLVSLLPTLREQQYSREEAICLEYMGDCELVQGAHATAFEHYKAALRIAEDTAPGGDLVPELGHRIGEALVHLGDPNGAILSCERGLRVAIDTGDRYEECATHRVLAMAHRAAGNPTKALRLADEGIRMGTEYEIPYETARMLTWVGEARIASRIPEDQAAGRRQLWEARALFDRIGLREQAAAIDVVLGFEVTEPSESEAADLGSIVEGLEIDRSALRFDILTTSPAVSEAVATIQSIAPSKIPVLIGGPSGVGKELLAHALHAMSDRRKGRFVAVNCGGLGPGLIDSEFFGHERGAFTGAVSSREGLIASADRGTLFLDEVGELPFAAQVALLRVLERGEVRRVGRDDTQTIDVRLVAATNADLEDMVARGVFRRDLFYRLNGVRVTLPPLHEREDDIRLLFRYFWFKVTRDTRKRLTLSEDVEAMLMAHSWPGNVRELKHEIARVVALAPDGSVVGREAFLPGLSRKSPMAMRERRKREEAVRHEREEILQALRAHRGNKADAARSLGGMKRTTLLYKIERHGIRPEEYLTQER